MAIFHRIPRGDLALEGGNLVWLRGGPQEMRNRIERRLKLFRGEWFLDTRIGIPYFENALVKNPNLSAIGALMRRAILSVPGVLEVTDFGLTFDPNARALTLTFHATTTEGDVVATGADAFIFSPTEAD